MGSEMCIRDMIYTWIPQRAAESSSSCSQPASDPSTGTVSCSAATSALRFTAPLAQAWGRCGHGAAKTREQRERRRRPRRQPRPQWSAGSRQPSGKWFDPWQPHGKNEQDTRRDGRRRPTDARPLGNRQPKHAASASPGCADTARVHTAHKLSFKALSSCGCRGRDASGVSSTIGRS